jgi:hypothetical protein
LILLFPVLVPVLFKEPLDGPATLVIRAVGTGIQLFIQEAAAFYGTAGVFQIAFAGIISQLAAFARRIFYREARTAIGTTAANKGNL